MRLSSFRIPGSIAFLGLGLTLAVFAGSAGLAGAADEDDPDGTRVPRLVIALYDGLDIDAPPEHEEPVWSVLQMPLNHLGLVVRAHDIRQGPPPRAWLDEARGVVTWLRPAPSAPEWLWPWLENEVASRAVRVVHLGSFGCLLEDRARLSAWLARFGLQWKEGFVGSRLRIETTFKSARLCAFEQDPRRYTQHEGPLSTGASNVVWVTTRDRNRREDVRTPVVTGPWGAFALDPWIVRFGDAPGARRWHLDPFAFFREALGVADVPAPHPSVLNGRRMFMLHVDGDGFESLSTVRPGVLSAQIFLEEILDHYNLPCTVSVIVGSIARDLHVPNPTDEMRLAQTILGRPFVEVASHGVLHPFRWNASWAPGRPPLATLPYKRVENYDYSPVGEVRDSVRFINEKLLADGKRCRVMLWTGDCLPPREAILECARVNCLNMNGGTYRWDEVHDSVSYVSPWIRRLQDAVQVTAGAANENEFPGFFTTHPRVFSHVGTTIERTGAGRILKPANVYVHFYSAETLPRLEELRKLIDRWGLKEPTAPVFVSTYVQAVLGALDARIFKTKSGWALRRFGGCRTVRLDNETHAVDLALSSGLLGSRRIGASLYVHLAGPDANVVLATSPVARPHVEEANHTLIEARLEASSIAFVSEALAPRVVVIAGLPSSADVEVTIGARSQTRRTSAKGRIELRLPRGGPDRIEVRVP